MNPKRVGYSGCGQSMLLFLLPVPLIVWLGLLLAPCLGGNLFSILDRLSDAFAQPFSIVWTDHTLRTVFLLLLIYGSAAIGYLSSRPKTREGEEHGSAKWGNAKQLNRMISQKENFLLTQHVSIGMDTHLHRRNLNILVLGGSGAGKTRSLALPNILEANCSYVVTDPKGEILSAVGGLLLEKGYDLRVFNLVDFSRSDAYNPFEYIRDDKDVLKLITNLIRNTTPKEAKTSDPFWEKAETALLEALMFYLLYEAPPHEQNFATILRMLSFAEVKEEKDDFISPLDLVFSNLEKKKPDSIAVRQFRIYKMAAGKTAKSINVSLAVRLAAFNLLQIQSITSRDGMDFGMLGERKMAIFAVIPDNDTSLSYLVGMLYTQIIQELYYKADHVHHGRLPVHVRLMLDEFANVSLPEEFDKSLATMRSREISATIIIQNLAQLKGLYKEHGWETITGNCDTLLYLGGNEQSTHKYISELLGKETIDTKDHSESKGKNGSWSVQNRKQARELLTSDEVRLLDNRYALLFIRGFPAVMDEKYDLTRHPSFSLTSSGGTGPYVHKQTGADFYRLEEAIEWEKADKYELLEEENE